MKKLFLMAFPFFLVFLIIFSFSLPALSRPPAINYAISCIGGSCEAKAGDLVVSWTYGVPEPVLTGVKLPFSVDTLKEVQQLADQTVSKVLSITKDKAAQAGIDQSGIGATNRNSESMSISKKRSLSLQSRLGESIRENITLKYVEYLAEVVPVCKKDRKPGSWLCAAATALQYYKRGDIADSIYMYLLNEKLKDVPKAELEKRIPHLSDDEAHDVMKYILSDRGKSFYLYDRMPDVSPDMLDYSKAFYAPNLLTAYRINRNIAFMRYACEKGYFKINPNETIMEAYDRFKHREDIIKYIPEFDRQISLLRVYDYSKYALAALVPVAVIAAGYSFFMKWRRKRT